MASFQRVASCAPLAKGRDKNQDGGPHAVAHRVRTLPPRAGALELQKPEEARTHVDELLFQTVHQVEELWMKAADDEITAARRPRWTQTISSARAHGLHRIYLLEKLMGDQLRLLETMAPLAYFAHPQGSRARLGPRVARASTA